MPESQERSGLVLSPESAAAAAPTPGKPRRFWFRFTATLFVLMVGTALWSGWYVYSKGFTRKWRNYVSAELRRYGLDISVRRITLDPFEGLVARDVTLRRADDPTGAVVQISRTSLDISLTQLWRREPFLNSIELRDATLRIPIDSTNPHGPVIEVKKLRARVLLPPGQVRVAQAEGECEGVQFSASGLLAITGEIPLFKDDGKVAKGVLESRRKLARAILDELKKLTFRGDPPRIVLEFSGDLAKPETLAATARFTSGPVQRGKWSLSKLIVAGRYESGLVRLENADLTDARGQLHAQADFRPGTGMVSGQIRSDLDLAGALTEFWPGALDFGITSREPPKIDLSVRARMPGSREAGATEGDAPDLELIGRVECGAFGARGIAFDGLVTEFSWRDGHWYLRSARLLHRSGELRADVMNAPGQLRAKISSTIDPDVITPLLNKEGRTLMSEFSFQDPPKLDFTAEGKTILDPFGFTAKGRAEFGRTRFRGVGLNRFSTDFEFKNLAIFFRKFTLERDEGRASGDQVVADIGQHELRFDNVRSTLNPNDVMVWINPNYPRFTRPYRFKRPPNAKVSGVLQFAGRMGTRFLIDFDAPNGLEYTFAKKNLPIAKLAGQLLFTEHRLQIQNLRGDMFGSAWRAEADIPINRSGVDYAASVETDGADFKAITKLYFGYDESEGRIAGTFKWTARGDDAASMAGSGRMKVDRGNVFAIPFLGPLSATLSKAAPGLGYNTANEASATFTAKGGHLDTKDFLVKGKGFSMIGSGWVGYLDEKMDFRIRVNAQGLPGVVLYPVSKLFEFGTQGPFSAPVWRPAVGTTPEAERPAEKPKSIPSAPLASPRGVR